MRAARPGEPGLVIELDLPPLVAGVRPPPPRRRPAGHARAGGAVRGGADARRAGRAHAAVLDGARDAAVRRRRSVPAFDRVFAEVFGTARGRARARRRAKRARPAPDERAGTSRRGRERDRRAGRAAAARATSEAHEAPVPVLGQRRGGPARQALRRARPGRARRAVPADERAWRSRRRGAARAARRSARRGEHIDLRRTLRGSLRTGGDPIRLARKRRRVAAAPDRDAVRHQRLDGALRARLPAVPGDRRARNAEAFVFATRLTRITRALATRNPERAIRRAAAAAPDWSSGTRIGDALRAFNDRHGRRGMARGAVIVILSDGWERGEPELVGARDGAAVAARLPDRVGQPARQRGRLRPRASAAWRRRCRTATRWSAATAWRRWPR